MPRYLLHFSKERGGTARGEWDELAGAETFTEAMIEALRGVGDYAEVMIITLSGASVEHVETLDLEEIADLLREWNRDGVFHTL